MDVLFNIKNMLTICDTLNMCWYLSINSKTTVKFLQSQTDLSGLAKNNILLCLR